MRVLFILFFLPTVIIASTPEQIELSYSMKGEQIIMTWSAQPDVAKYIVESGNEIDKDGEVIYSKLFETSSWQNYQVNYNDESEKPQAIVYYKVYGLNSSGEVIANKEFTANYTSKDKYTLNINLNYYAEYLEVELNSKDGGTASISIENLADSYHNNIVKEVAKGYNNFIIDVKDNESAEKLIVKIDHNDKVQYRMVELTGNFPSIITSDE